MLPRPPLTPVVKLFLIVLFTAFVTQVVLENIVGLPVTELLAVSSGTPLGPFSLVQIFTHVLVNPLSPTSLVWMLVGLLFLWWVGSPFEMRLGPKQTWWMALVGTVSAGIGTLLAAQVMPGASLGNGPIIVAFIVGYAVTLPPNAQLSFFGVLPLKPKSLILFLVAFVVLGGLVGANFAGIVGDLTSIAASYGYMIWLLRPRRPKPRPTTKRSDRPKRRKDHGFQVIQGGGGGGGDDEDDDDDDRPRWLN